MKEEEIGELEERLKERKEEIKRLNRIQILCKARLIERPKKKGIFSLKRYCPKCGKELKRIIIGNFWHHACDCGYEWVDWFPY